jgi:hypothetical protein
MRRTREEGRSSGRRPRGDVAIVPSFDASLPITLGPPSAVLAVVARNDDDSSGGAVVDFVPPSTEEEGTDDDDDDDDDDGDESMSSPSAIMSRNLVLDVKFRPNR